MGCGGSTNKDQKVKRRRGTLFHQPKVRIQIGNGVKILDRKPRVIIVFGGPGTKKGVLLQNLANVFNFEIINIEEIIFEEIGKTIENPQPGKLVQAVQTKLKTEQELLRLDSVLKMVCRKLQNVDKEKFCIIDLVPNLKFMLNNPMLIKDCTNELRYFEEQYPVSFAINFVMPKEKVMDKLDIECTKAGQEGNQSVSSGTQSDEADSSRTQKRVLLHDNSIRHFVEYFNKKEKVVTIDVSCGIPDTICTSVYEFFEEFDFKAQTINETVIIYAFDSKDLAEINLAQYSLTVVPLKEIVIDPNGEAMELIDQVCMYIDHSDPTRNVFAVDCRDTSLSKTLQKKKSKKMIQFTDSGSDCKVGKYCSVSLTDKDDPATLRAVASIQNEVCLFVSSIPEDLCKWVAQVMVECRKKRAKS